VFASLVAWWNPGLPRLVFSPEPAPIHRRIETTWNNMSNPVRSQWPGPKSRKAASRHRWQAPAWSSA